MEIHSAIAIQSHGLMRSQAQASPRPASALDVTTDAKNTAEDQSVEEAQATVEPKEDQGDTALELTPDEQSEVEQLKERDSEVRAHEQAHVAAGGQYVTSGPTYEYQDGPNGQSYAIGGEVGIDTSIVSGDPAASLAKARVIIRAALAPAEPSTQDQSVAASARAMEVEAQRELGDEQRMLRAEMTQTTQDSEDAASGSSGTASTDAGDADSTSRMSGTRASLEQRIAGLFAAPADAALSRYA